jgi:hypothetical protein
LYLAVCLIAVKDWAKPPSDHADPYHLGIRFVGFLTAVLAEIFLLKFALLSAEICCSFHHLLRRGATGEDLQDIRV